MCKANTWLNLAELQEDKCCQQKTVMSQINIESLYITKRGELTFSQTNVTNPSDERYLTPKWHIT